MQRPAIVRRSLKIQIATLIAAPIVCFVIDRRPIPKMPLGANPLPLLFALFILAGFLGLYLVLLQFTYKGKNWARWVLATFTVATIWVDAPEQLKNFSRAPLITTLN